ncbi:MAG: hypothetical protein ACF8XB_06450 [Planctomycetota bacterium JB042]
MKPILLLAPVLLAACAVPPSPDGFLVVDEGRHRVKSIASDDSMYWVRTFPDSLRGTLDFWRETLRNDLVDHRGYVVLEERDVEWGGAPAVEMLCEVTAEGRARRYLITFRIEEGLWRNTIHVAEFVAEKGVFEEHVESVRDVLREA